LCFVIGPASKAAAYKLMGEGYRCFDLGHYIKDYDLFRKDGAAVADAQKGIAVGVTQESATAVMQEDASDSHTKEAIEGYFAPDL